MHNMSNLVIQCHGNKTITMVIGWLKGGVHTYTDTYILYEYTCLSVHKVFAQYLCN